MALGTFPEKWLSIILGSEFSNFVTQQIFTKMLEMLEMFEMLQIFQIFNWKFLELKAGLLIHKRSIYEIKSAGNGSNNDCLDFKLFKLCVSIMKI